MTLDARELTCSELSEFLARYFAGELGPDERARFEKHLAECPECVVYVRSYSETMRLAKNAYELDAMSDDAPETLIRAILEARQRETRVPRPSSKRR
jgi:anti-sigma factor RsiW